MTDTRRVLVGLVLGISIFLASVAGGDLTDALTGRFTLAYVMVPLLSFVLSAIAIRVFASRGMMEFRAHGIKPRSVVAPVLITLVATFATGVVVRVLTAALGLERPQSTHVSFMSPIQVVFFIFLFGSIAEETLFRGFVQNMLAPLKASGLSLFRARLSAPVLISALLFGLAHFSLLGGLADLPWVAGVVANAIVMGMVAGYYQEKHDNFLYAVIVHMASNFPIAVMAFLQ